MRRRYNPERWTLDRRLPSRRQNDHGRLGLPGGRKKLHSFRPLYSAAATAPVPSPFVSTAKLMFWKPAVAQLNMTRLMMRN
jgi:hypothetical protein